MNKFIANIIEDWNDGTITTDEAMNAFGNLLEENKGRSCVKTYIDSIRKVDPYHEHTCRPSDDYNNIFECSECGEIDTDGIPNYCPGCGAKVSRSS